MYEARTHVIRVISPRRVIPIKKSKRTSTSHNRAQYGLVQKETKSIEFILTDYLYLYPYICHIVFVEYALIYIAFYILQFSEVIQSLRLSEHVSLLITIIAIIIVFIIINNIKLEISKIKHSCAQGNIMPPSPKRQAGRKRVAAKRKVSEIEGGDPSHAAAKKKRVRPF